MFIKMRDKNIMSIVQGLSVCKYVKAHMGCNWMYLGKNDIKSNFMGIFKRTFVRNKINGG